MGVSQRFFVPFVCVVVIALGACNRAPELPPSAITIDLVTGATTSDAVVRVTGLSGEELRSIASAGFDDAAWQSLLRVTVSDAEASGAVAGRYGVTATAVEYRPRFPFDPGRAYTARFDQTRLPTPRAGTPVTARLRLAPAAPSDPATVTMIFPSGAVWPENMLRFYIHFSAPMSRGSGTKFVHLVDHEGKEVPDAILAAYGDLWNDATTRLTVFFDPGRVKRGVGPNVRMGRAIVEGRRYAITVDAAWKDAQGQALAAPFKREFTAGPALYQALSATDWKISAPRAGTRELVTIAFPAPLDRALLERTISLQTAAGGAIPGRVQVGESEASWMFIPAEAWKAGDYRLVVQTVLEDPAGNKIGRAFEVMTGDPASHPPDQDVVTVPFTVRPMATGPGPK